MNLLLASASPRRTALLTQMGFAHRQQAVDIDESALADETPQDQVCRLALQKAQAAFARLSADEQADTVVLASDTLIAFHGQSLGKPANKDDCVAMLRALSNNQHEVLTSICVLNQHKQHTRTITTQVHFAPLTDDDIEAYWASGEPQDKAGSYAIQGRGGQFVRSVHGSVSAVIGLPMYETRCLLNEFGVHA